MKSSRIGAKQVFTIMETTLRHMENKAIGDSQHSFTKGQLCLTNVVAFSDGVTALDRGRITEK